MPYTFESRIRYSEIDSEGCLMLPALLNYFQDVTTFQSEDLGLGIAYTKERNLAWVLSAWQIVVDRYPGMGEKVTVGTFPTEFKAFMGSRNFYMLDEKGEYLAKANTLWSLLRTDTGKPSLPTADMLSGYILEEKLEMDYAPRKIAVPEGGIERESIYVKKHHLDTNHHVNNGQYVSIAMEYLPENFVITQMRAEYKMQAFLDDVMYPYIVEIAGRNVGSTESGMGQGTECCGKQSMDNRAEKGYVITLSDEQGRPYVAVEFLGKEPV